MSSKRARARVPDNPPPPDCLPTRLGAIVADVDRAPRACSNAACVRIAAPPARVAPRIVRALFFPLSDVARAPELVRAHAHAARIAAIRERFQRVRARESNRTRARASIARLPTRARRGSPDAATRARFSRARAPPIARRARAAFARRASTCAARVPRAAEP